MTLQTFVFRTLAAAAVAGAGFWATPAAASADGPDYYRVVNVQGNETLKLRSRPSQYSRTLDSMSFNARRIRHTGNHRRGWVQVRHNGQRGWVNASYLAEDSRNADITYQVTGVSNGDRLNLRQSPSVRAGILRTIPRRASGLEHCGSCEGGWCPVRFRGTNGWVSQRFLKVERTSSGYNEQQAEGYNPDDDGFSSNGNQYTASNRYGNGDRYDTSGSYQTTNSFDADDRRSRNRRRADRWRGRFRKWFFGD